MTESQNDKTYKLLVISLLGRSEKPSEKISAQSVKKNMNRSDNIILSFGHIIKYIMFTLRSPLNLSATQTADAKHFLVEARVVNSSK